MQRQYPELKNGSNLPFVEDNEWPEYCENFRPPLIGENNHSASIDQTVEVRRGKTSVVVIPLPPELRRQGTTIQGPLGAPYSVEVKKSREVHITYPHPLMRNTTAHYYSPSNSIHVTVHIKMDKGKGVIVERKELHRNSTEFMITPTLSSEWRGANLTTEGIYLPSSLSLRVRENREGKYHFTSSRPIQSNIFFNLLISKGKKKIIIPVLVEGVRPNTDNQNSQLTYEQDTLSASNEEEVVVVIGNEALNGTRTTFWVHNSSGTNCSNSKYQIIHNSSPYSLTVREGTVTSSPYDQVRSPYNQIPTQPPYSSQQSSNRIQVTSDKAITTNFDFTLLVLPNSWNQRACLRMIPVQVRVNSHTLPLVPQATTVTKPKLTLTASNGTIRVPVDSCVEKVEIVTTDSSAPLNARVSNGEVLVTNGQSSFGQTSFILLVSGTNCNESSLIPVEVRGTEIPRVTDINRGVVTNPIGARQLATNIPPATVHPPITQNISRGTREVRIPLGNLNCPVSKTQLLLNNSPDHQLTIQPPSSEGNNHTVVVTSNNDITRGMTFSLLSTNNLGECAHIHTVNLNVA